MAEAGFVLAASRVLVGISATSLAAVEDLLTPAQFRALLIIASRGPLHLGALADGMGVHPSQATRLCDRLVNTGFIDWRDNPADRRHLALLVTESGQQVVDGVTQQRVVAITAVLRRMPASDRADLARVMSAFAAAAGEPEPATMWSLGWAAAAST